MHDTDLQWLAPDRVTRHTSTGGLRRHIQLNTAAGYVLIGYGYEGDALALHWRFVGC